MNEHLIHISCVSRLAVHCGGGLVDQSGHPPHTVTHHTHEYHVDMLWFSMQLCGFPDAPCDIFL